MSWKVYATGFIATISKNNTEIYKVNPNKAGTHSFVSFKVVSSRPGSEGKKQYEAFFCKKYIKNESVKSFCNLLKDKTQVFVEGTLECYLNKDKQYQYSINLYNMEILSKIENTEVEEPVTEDAPF